MAVPLQASRRQRDDSREESSWVPRIRAGDKAAFAFAFRAYYRPLCAYVLGHVGIRAVAEELVQDVFANLWAQRSTLYVQDSIRTYLFGAARNRAYNWIRDQRVVARWAGRAVHEAATSGMSRGPEPPDERVRDQELAAALADAVARLTARQREAFLLRARGNLSQVEIARVMGIALKTLENTLTHAFKALRKDLAPFL